MPKQAVLLRVDPLPDPVRNEPKNYTVSLTRGLLEDLRIFAFKSRRKQNEVVRLALERYFEEEQAD